MRYRYFVDLWRDISVFANFSYGIVVLGSPQYSSLSQFFPAIFSHWCKYMPGQNTLFSGENIFQ